MPAQRRNSDGFPVPVFLLVSAPVHEQDFAVPIVDYLKKHPPFAVAIICMLVFLGVMMMPPGKAARLRTDEGKSLVNARKLCLACWDYSREHGGTFPPTLDALIPKYLQDRSQLASPLSPDSPDGYTYTAPTPDRDDSPDTVVIEDKFSPTITHNRLVVYANASAKVVPEPPPAQ